MTRKRLNKNLVAFLTVMGMLLTVIVVWVATSQISRKDPEFWATTARQKEAAGDYEAAIELYQRAYRVSKGPGGAGRDVAYLVEAARAAYRYGEIGGALEILSRAHDEQPTNPDVLVMCLDYLWDLCGLPEAYPRFPLRLRSTTMKYAETLQRVQPQHVLGPLMEAVLLWSMIDPADRDPARFDKGDEALARAEAIEAQDPRVVRTLRVREYRLGMERIAQAEAQGASRPEVEALHQATRDKLFEMLAAGAQANPDNWHIVGMYVDELLERGQKDEARAMLQRALQARPNDPEVHLGMAGYLWRVALQDRQQLTPEVYGEMFAEARRHAQSALSQEPALYEAYYVLAQVALLGDLKQVLQGQIPPENFEAALKIYEDALRQTAGIRSLQATLGESHARPRLHVRAFVTATDYLRMATNEAERRERLSWARKFLEQTEIRYKDQPFTYFMRGETQTMEGNLAAAVQAFEAADKTAAAERGGIYPAMWFTVFRGALPVERLAMLYRQLEQPGESLKYSDETIRRYQEDQEVRAFTRGGPPPLYIVLNRVECLNLVGRYQEAYDFAQLVRRVYGPQIEAEAGAHLRLAAVEADALRQMGQPERAEEALRGAGHTAAALVTQARLAAMQHDYAALEQRLRELLAAEDLHPRLAAEVFPLLGALLAAEREPLVTEMLRLMKDRFGQHEPLMRAVRQYEVILSTRDPAERDARQREILEGEKDPQTRARGLFAFHAQRREWEKARQYLDELERANPNDAGIQQQQFQLAVVRAEFERAAQYAARLAQANADGAGGAVLRGDLAAAQEKWDEAVNWYRDAQRKLPRTCALQVSLGRSLLGVGRTEEALVALEEAVRLNPRDFDANKFLYLAYQAAPPERRPADEGDSLLERARQLNPNDPYVRQQAELAAEKRDPQQGIRNREQRRAAEPNDVENLVRLAQLYALVADGDRATERLLEASRLQPGEWAVALEAARFFSTAGRREPGEQVLRAFLEAQSGAQRGGGLALLGKFYERLGDLAAAEAAFKDGRRVVAEAGGDAEERRRAVVRATLELVDFYRRVGGRDEELIEACRGALDQLPAGEQTFTAAARMSIIQGLLNLKRYGDAEREVEAYTRDFPGDPRGLVVTVQLRLAQQQWLAAYEALTQLLQKEPEHFRGLLERGRLGVRLGRYVEAREDLLKARAIAQSQRERQPGDLEAQAQFLNVSHDLSVLYEVSGQNELAEAEMRKILDETGAWLEAIRKRPPRDAQEAARQQEAAQGSIRSVSDRLIALLSRVGQIGKAKQIVSEYMSREAEDWYWPHRFALVCMDEALERSRVADLARDQGRATDEKRDREAATRQHESAAEYFRRASLLAEQGGHKMAAALNFGYYLDSLAAAGRALQAVQEFDRVREGSKDLPAVIPAAIIRAYQALGRNAEALEQLERALEAGGREALQTVQAVLGLSGEYLPAEQVLETLQRVAERAPLEEAPAWRLRQALATKLLHAGQPAEALRVITPVLSHAPPTAPEWAAAMLTRAQSQHDSGDVPGALQVLHDLLAAIPDHAVAMNNLAYYLVDSANRPKEALKYAEQAREREPRNAAFLDTLGWVYFKNGLHDQAESALKEAVTVNDKDPAAKYHLAMLYIDRGRTAEARLLLQAVQTLAAEKKHEEYARKAREALSKLP